MLIITNEETLPEECDNCVFSYLDTDYYGDMCNKCAVLNTSVMGKPDDCPLMHKKELFERLSHIKLNGGVEYSKAVNDCIEILQQVLSD